MTQKLVTVVIPSFNQGRFIRETIDSCLSQDYRPLEILVFDGGSKDETVAVLQSYSVPELQWWSKPDKGVVDAVNKGLIQAKGNILTIQSSDDVFLPGAVSAAVQKLTASPELHLVYGDVELIDENSNQIGEDKQPGFSLCEYLGRLQYIPQPGTFFSREAMVATGGWREEFSYAADADYWMRMLCRFPAANLQRSVARYRYHSAQRDTQNEKIARDWVAAVQNLIQSDALSRPEHRYARMGIELAKYRYAPVEQWWYRTRKLYRAAAINPAAVMHSNFPKRELLPGREPIWKQLSRLKRSLGFSPRGA